jgi:PAS domain S-box-containing protein
MPIKLNLKISQIGIIIVIVPILLQVVFVGWLAYLLWQADVEKMREVHAKELLQVTDNLYKLAYSAGFNLSTYLTEGYSQEHKDNFQEALSKIPAAIERADAVVKNHPKEEKLLDEIKPDIYDVCKRLDKVAKLMDGRPSIASFYTIQRHRDYIEKFGEKFANWLPRFVKEAQTIETTSPEKQKQLRKQQGLALVIGLIANIAMAFALAGFFARQITNRLTIMTDNTKRLVEDRPLNPEQSGVAEIAQLDHVFHDMAQALKEAAQKERAIIQNASEVICSLDSNGQFGKLNPASLSVWGYAFNELIGKSLLDIVDLEDKEKTRQAIVNAGNDTNISFENRIKCKDGSLVDMLWSTHWSSEEKTLFCVAHDITNRKELERLKQEFMAMVSHDMRTPLTSVLATVKLLAKGTFGVLPGKANERLDVVTRNLDRLVALINDLLDIEKLESGQMQLNKESLQIKQVLERSLQELEQYALDQNIKLELVASESQAVADEDRLIQVIINLLANAIKFSPKGGIVKINSEQIDNNVWVKVIDQGRGVPSSHKEIIFERFKQVESADGKRKAGTGLGLPICKQIIESHGGKIGVDSENGEGSTFWFWIPAQNMPKDLIGRLEESVELQDKSEKINA